MKLLGVCGETELANAKQSLNTVMQVSLTYLVRTHLLGAALRFLLFLDAFHCHH